MDAQDFRSLQEAYMEVVMNEGLGGARRQPDYDEYNNDARKKMEASADKLRQQIAANKQKSQAQEFLKKHPRKKELTMNK